VTVEALTLEWQKAWIPLERMGLADWAEKNFHLSPEYSAVTGELRLYGWQREIFNSFTDPTVNKIVLKVGTQLVKTLFIQAALAYIIAEMPGPTLFVQPKEKDAEDFSKERLEPMLRDNPLLRGMIPEGKSPRNLTTFKQFPNGALTIVGSIVPGNMARRSIQYLIGDEINKYPRSAGKEGSPLLLAEERAATFGSRAKIIYACSPTHPDGLISQEYELSDQRQPWACCPHCNHSQVLQWIQVRFDKKGTIEERAESARYYCEQCDRPWNDNQRWKAAEAAEWIGSRPFTGTAGFWISHLYSPHKTLAKIVSAWLRAAESGSIENIQVFKNTNLAEDFRESGDAPESQRLYERRERYKIGTVPARALFITAGVDVQKDRLEISIYGWGRGVESWLVDHIVLNGDPTQTASIRLENGSIQKPVWDRLTDLLNSTWIHESGTHLSLMRLGIDSGYATNEVYRWARQQGSARVLPLDPHGRETAAIVGQPSPVDVTVGGRKIKRGIKVWPVAVSRYKSEFYGFLRLDMPIDGELKPGYCHYPDMDIPFFKQLVAEELVSKTNRAGFHAAEWQKTGPNEALDCRNYARACASVVGIDRFRDHNWKTLEWAVAKKVVVEQQTAAIETSTLPTTPITVKPKKRTRQIAGPTHEFGRGSW